MQKEEENKNIEDKTSELEKKSDEYLNNWKRSAADLINYKKDEMERMAKLLQYSKEDMVLDILPILDNIYLAEKQLPEDLKKGEKGSQQAIEWTKGFLMIKKQLEDFLKQKGIEEIKVDGEKFNPETMEAVEGNEGDKIEELQKGYMMDGKVIRPAKIKIIK